MTKKGALRLSAGLTMLAWLALSGCGGMGSSGCGANPNTGIQPNCSAGTYAQMNSDGSYGACQPIPNANSTSNSGTTTTPAGP